MKKNMGLVKRRRYSYEKVKEELRRIRKKVKGKKMRKVPIKGEQNLVDRLFHLRFLFHDFSLKNKELIKQCLKGLRIDRIKIEEGKRKKSHKKHYNIRLKRIFRRFKFLRLLYRGNVSRRYVFSLKLPVKKDKKKSKLYTTISLSMFLRYSSHIGKPMEYRNRNVYPYLLCSMEQGVVFNPYMMLKEIKFMLNIISLRTIYYEEVLIHVPLKNSDESLNKEYRAEAKGDYYLIDRWIGGIFSNYKWMYRRAVEISIDKSGDKRKARLSRINKNFLQLLTVKNFLRIPTIFIGLNINHSPINEALRLGMRTFMFIDSDYNGEIAHSIVPYNLSTTAIMVLIRLLHNVIRRSKSAYLSFSHPFYVKGLKTDGVKRKKLVKRNVKKKY